MVAFSVSSTIKLSSCSTSSPSLTLTSITSTPDESPISGIMIGSERLPPADGAGALFSGAGVSSAASLPESLPSESSLESSLESLLESLLESTPPPDSLASSFTIKSPSETLSPTFTSTDLTTPASLEGTSIVALSVSRTIKLSSTSISSPTLTNTSITSTPLASPISGIFTSVKFAKGTSSNYRVAGSALSASML